MITGIDAKRIFFNNSGLGHYGRRFYHALARNNADESFILYSPKDVPSDNPYLNEIHTDNSRIISPGKALFKLFGGSPWRSWLISRRLEEDHLDIYYGISNELPFGIGRKNLKKVVIIHDLIFVRYPELYPAVDVMFYKMKARYACRYADRIIAASEQTKRDIITYYSVAAEKISVLYPAGHPMFYSDTVANPDEFFKPPRKYMISIGAITPRKNLLKSVQAFARVYQQLDIDLVVIGTAVGMGKKYLEKIMDYIRQNNLSERIHFLGNVPYHYVPGLCRNARLMLYPSQFEGFGMPIVEGLFSKIPVITSIGGCFPEAGGNGAVYVNPDNIEEIAGWIGKLTSDQGLREDLITKGFHHAQQFTQENIEKAITDFHRSMISPA